MSFHDKYTKAQRVHHRLLRVLFALLLFCYFYFFQSPLLILAQHQLSEGRTAYHPLWGALLLTSLLVLLQGAVCRLFRPMPRHYLSSAVPSVVCAILLTAFTPVASVSALVLAGILLLGFLVLSPFLRLAGGSAGDRRGDTGDIAAHIAWLLLISVALGWGSHSNDVVTYEVRTAQSLVHHEPLKALRVGHGSLATSPRLTALRAYALASMPCSETAGTRLPELLFSFPLPSDASSAMLLYDASDAAACTLPVREYHALMGSAARAGEAPLSYFERAFSQARLRGDSIRRAVCLDYWLCGLLLDRDLETFARTYHACVLPSDTLAPPRYYREALYLYARRHSRPCIGYHSAEIEANFEDFRREERLHTDLQRRAAHLRLLYGDTYWWYYFYGSKHAGRD